MVKVHERIGTRLHDWLLAQPVFVVATAPGEGGHVNASPKGMAGTFAILDETTVAYLDYTGSGAETIAHVRENGRITLMWSAFEGPPRIVRVHGRGEVLAVDDRRVDGLFEPGPGARAIILVHADRVSDSCGYAVPLYEHVGERTKLDEWAAAQGPDGLAAYHAKKNAVSIDGLPALVDGVA